MSHSSTEFTVPSESKCSDTDKKVTVEKARRWVNKAPQRYQEEYLKKLPQEQKEKLDSYSTMIRIYAKEGKISYYRCFNDVNVANHVTEQLRATGFSVRHWDNFIFRGCVFTSWK